jgi:hypothetical protein
MQFVRPSTKLPAWYAPPNPDYPDTYELTNRGLGEIAAAMSIADLLDNDAPVPPLPRWEDFGLSAERREELSYFWVYRREPGQPTLADVLEPHERQPVAQYLAAFEAATGQPAPPARALGYKFRSCDGWLVTAGECLVIADGLDAALAHQREVLVLELGCLGRSHDLDSIECLLSPWSKYNRVAADHEGYRIW